MQLIKHSLYRKMFSPHLQCFLHSVSVHTYVHMFVGWPVANCCSGERLIWNITWDLGITSSSRSRSLSSRRPRCCLSWNRVPCALSFEPAPDHLASLKWHQLLPTHQLTDQLSLILRSLIAAHKSTCASRRNYNFSPSPRPHSHSRHFCPFATCATFCLLSFFIYWGHACRRVYGRRPVRGGWEGIVGPRTHVVCRLIAHNELLTEWGDWKTVAEEKTASLWYGKSNQRTITTKMACRYLLLGSNWSNVLNKTARMKEILFLPGQIQSENCSNFNDINFHSLIAATFWL